MRQNPFDNGDRMFDAFDDLWTRFPFGGMDRTGMGEGAGSNVSLEREDGGYVVLADLPGFGKEDLDIRFEDGRLTITGAHGTEETGEGAYRSRSRRVHETVRVPGDVLVEDITASLKNGVLEIHLPVEGEADGHRIDID
jgi:HSP20 family protein